MTTRRWSNDQKTLGPFLVASNKKGHSPFQILLSSGDGEDEDNGCHLMITLIWFTLIIDLPNFVLRGKEVKDPGFNTTFRCSREYGFTFSEEFLHLRYGVQTMTNITTKCHLVKLPWLARHLKAVTLFDKDGKVHVEGNSHSVLRKPDYIDDVAVHALIRDGEDDELITASVYMYDLTYGRGSGKFKWLSWFFKDEVTRRLNILYSSEFGPEKGSWKGGILEHSFIVDREPTPLEAFRTCCRKHNAEIVE